MDHLSMCIPMKSYAGLSHHVCSAFMWCCGEEICLPLEEMYCNYTVQCQNQNQVVKTVRSGQNSVSIF